MPKKIQVIQYTNQIHKILTNVKDYRPPPINLTSTHTENGKRPRSDEDGRTTEESSYNNDFTLSYFEGTGGTETSTSNHQIRVTISNPSDDENGESVCYWNGIRLNAVPRTISKAAITLEPGDCVYAGVLSNKSTAIPIFEVYRNNSGHREFVPELGPQANDFVATFDDYTYREIGVVSNSTANELSITQSFQDGRMYMTCSTSAKPLVFPIRSMLTPYSTEYSTSTGDDGLEYREIEDLPKIGQRICISRGYNGCYVNNKSFALPGFQSSNLMTLDFSTTSEICLVSSLDTASSTDTFSTVSTDVAEDTQTINGTQSFYFALKFIPQSTSTSTTTSTSTSGTEASTSSSTSTSTSQERVELLAMKHPSDGSRSTAYAYYDIGRIRLFNSDTARHNVNEIEQSLEGLATSPQMLWFKTC